MGGQRRKRYLKEHRQALYTALLLSGELNSNLTEIDTQVETMFSQLINQMAEQESITEQLKAENQMEWVGKINNIRQRAEEIINTELILSWIQLQYCKWAALLLGVPLMLAIGISLRSNFFLPLEHLTERPSGQFDPLSAEILLQFFAELQWKVEEPELQG